MPARFASNLLIALLGGALAACSLLFAPSVVRWMGLGVGCAAVVITLAGFAVRGRGLGQCSLDLVIAPLGAWTILSSCSYTGTELRWLSFSAGAALAGLAVVGLISHEVVTERELRRAAEAITAREARALTELRQPVAARPDVAA